jgi:dihydrofolate synthase/folylpolyglutamate synthase
MSPQPSARSEADPWALPAPVDLDDLLVSQRPLGVDLGLERLRGALAEAGHPERCFPALQVAGTNGKGSICTMLHAILRAAGVHCGTYRSPHLQSWCERLQLGDAWISPTTLREDVRRWLPLGERHRLTVFELLTAASFDRLARDRVELAVLEVGLGGRLDATTTHPDRRVVGFASIGLDHREVLGDSLTAIAREKAGVLAPGVIAISAPQPAEVAAVLEATAHERGSELRWVEPLASPARGGPRLGLVGDLQRHNGAVAVAMARALAETGWRGRASAIEEGAILAGLAAARWPGRLDRRSWRGREILLDGAHNPPAAVALRQELDRRDGEGGRHWLLGMQRHKEGAALVRALLRPQDRAAIVAIPEHPSWDPQALGEAAPELAGQLVEAASPEAGLNWLLAAPPPMPVVAGSLYLLGAILPLLDRPPGGGSDDPPAHGQAGFSTPPRQP